MLQSHCASVSSAFRQNLTGKPFMFLPEQTQLYHAAARYARVFQAAGGFFRHPIP
jgi:predicted short-subunit dehydrogenase-like oxidoreductase (DUF2520 family)